MPCPRKLPAIAIPLGIFAILLASCSSDSPTTPTDQPAPLAQITLGPTGGTLETEDFQLHILPDQLPASTTLSLYLEPESSPQPTAEASPVYRLTGLPHGLSESLPIRIRHNSATPTAPLHIMLGQFSHTPSLGTRQLNWQIVACTDSSGWALAELPLTGPAATTKEEAPPVHVTVTEGLVTTLSPDQLFQITYHPDQASELDIAALGIELDTALGLYQFMGYEQPGFNAWPLQVNVHPIEASGYWSPDPRHLGGHIALNPIVVTDVIEQATTVGHEMFHFCQYFYDLRSVLERGTEGPDHRWLDEATAVHMETYFAPPDYQTISRIGHELELLNGLLTPRDGLTLGQHGYGVSSLIRYLAQTEQGGDNFVQNLYEDLTSGTHAAAALQAATSTDIPAQWQHILEELVLGNIYDDVTWPVLDAQAGPNLLSVGSAADTTGTLSGRMNDLSGLLATVELDYADWTSEHRLELWAEQADIGLSVLGITTAGDRHLVAHGTPSVTLTDPRPAAKPLRQAPGPGQQPPPRGPRLRWRSPHHPAGPRALCGGRLPLSAAVLPPPVRCRLGRRVHLREPGNQYSQRGRHLRRRGLHRGLGQHHRRGRGAFRGILERRGGCRVPLGQ